MNSAWLEREPGYEMKSRGMYMIILQRFLQLKYFDDEENNDDKRIKKAIKYIIDHYSENLTVYSVGKAVGLSAS